jgi:ribosomal protein L11 methyltransferase
MVSLTLVCLAAESEWLAAELWEHGATGLQEEDLPGGRVQLRAFFESAAGLHEVFAAHAPSIAEEPEVDWDALWRSSWQPREIGARLYLAPAWDDSPTPAGRIRVTIHPGGALGTGEHPATRLALELLERHVVPGESLLDVGTGSGVLAAAACLLGAGAVTACDIAPDAVAEAARNLGNDGLPVRLFAGSLRSLRSGSARVAVANLNAATHRVLAQEYLRLAPRLLLLTGFKDREADALAARFAASGYRAVDTLASDDWVALALCNDEPS